ncbi:MAG: GNAT family N-acetyltransferase [Planctomycetota bacterium]|nr:GNAT family N-acetyltransferase [Planctomycetota bacterium]
MGLTYYKRLRLEFELAGARLPEPFLPSGYEWVPWSLSLLERHAVTKFASFRSEVDSQIFPCLGARDGCLNLMSEIAQRATFVPQATWLISCRFPDGTVDDCATIQGLVQAGQWGAIQNVGVVPEYRGHGLGRALMFQCLRGFQQARVPRVYLEVTASNSAAVQLYRSVGFCLAKTTYKAVERADVEYSVA